MRWVAGWVCVLLALSGCDGDGTSSESDPERFVEQQHEWPLAINAQLDLLFVVDTSSSMAAELAGLEDELRDMATVLEQITPCKPSMHIGVASANLGAGPHEVLGCAPDGDGGALLDAPRLAGCGPPDDAFIRDVVLHDGTRETNYDGSLGDALACIGSLPADGCEFPQPLEAMRLALEGNPGFHRDGAFLMVVFITDSDDCSAADTALFDPDDAALGPLSPFRCFEYGVECSPDDPRTPGSKSECQPRGDSAHLYGLDEYKDFLRTLAPDSDTIVSAAVGPAEPVEVGTAGGGGPILEPSCQNARLEASPAIRLHAFSELFPARNHVSDLCADPIVDVLTLIAQPLFTTVGVPCLRGDLVDIDDQRPGIQPECAVTETLYADSETIETVIPPCDNEADPDASSVTPCYLIFEDELNCPDTPTRLTLELYPDRTCVPGYRRLSVRCIAR